MRYLLNAWTPLCELQPWITKEFRSEGTSGAIWCKLLLSAGLTSALHHLPQDLVQSIVSIPKDRVNHNLSRLHGPGFIHYCSDLLFFSPFIHLEFTLQQLALPLVFFCLHVSEWWSRLNETTSLFVHLYVIGLSTQPSQWSSTGLPPVFDLSRFQSRGPKLDKDVV